MKYAAILAGGEGSRLSEIVPFKPLLQIQGEYLLNYQLSNLLNWDVDYISVILHEKGRQQNLNLVSNLKNSKVHSFFKSPPSSMHSLLEVVKSIDTKNGDHLFVTMVDTILAKKDLLAFFEFCSQIKKGESAILTTPFVNDEKPLTVDFDSDNYISAFQVPIKVDIHITSGMYYLSHELLSQLKFCEEMKIEKMRNFLKWSIENNFKMKAFDVEQTIDVDRQEDIILAEEVLKQYDL